MKKSYTLFTLVSLCLFVSIGNAFAQVFWSEDFSNGIPTDWINDNLLMGPALWFHCNDVASCPPKAYGPEGQDLGFGIFNAPSADNGYAYYDSFSWINAHQGILRTSEISIGGHDKVFLEFYTHIATLNKSPDEYVRLDIITTDDTIPFKIFPGLIEAESVSANAYRVNLDLTSYLEGIETIQLQWYWDGIQEFSWCIDDIILSNQDPSLPENICWSERFAFGMEDWTSTNQNEPDALWEWVEGGDVGPAAFARAGTVIQSPTGVDGAMIFNADFLTGGGSYLEILADPFHYYRSDLISPAIDLSCNGKPLELQFYQIIKKGNTAPNAPESNQGQGLITSISWSTDGAENWSPPIDASPFIFPRFSNSDPINQEKAVITLPPELSGVEEFYLRFTWAGDLFFWGIDDIVIADRPNYDLKLNRNFFAIMPNAMTPYWQVGDVAFLADLTNIGCLEATGVKNSLDIYHGISGDTIFSDQLSYPSVQSDELIENVFFNQQLNDNDFSRTGPYIGAYSVSQDSGDWRQENDIISWAFEISDSTFAKELGPTRNITSSETFNFTYGNCFFVPNGSGKYARWISVGISNIEQLADAGAEISTFLYKWEDLNNNDLAEPNEYEFAQQDRGVNTYQFSDLEDDDGYITLPVHFEGDGIPLEDSTYYIVVVQYIASNNVSCFFQASDQFNYQASAFISDSLGRKRYASVLDLNNTGTFDFIGFGLGIVPVVRLHIGANADLSVPGILHNSTTKLDRDQLLDIFPNPNDGSFTLDLSLNHLSRYVGLEVLNMSGSILISKNFENIKEKQFNLNFPTIPPGSYLLKVQTDQQIFTRKFIVQHE